MARRLTGGVPNHGRPYISGARGGTFTKRNGMWVPDPMRRYGKAVMQGATSWYDTRDLTSSTQQTLPNRLFPSASPAQLGSTSGSDTNDPLALPYDGTPYVHTPNTNTANNLTVSGFSVSNVTDVSVMIDQIRPKWIGTGSTSVLGGSNTDGWVLFLSNTGTLSLFFYNSGTTTYVSAAATTTYAFADNTRYRVRVTRSAAGSVNFYVRPHGGSETQVGTTVSTAAATTTSISTLGINAVAYGSTVQAASTYFVEVTLTGSTTVTVTLNPAVETLGQASWTCTTGQTVTVNRATSGLTTAVVTRPLLMADGTDDYVQLPAGDTPTFTATTGEFTVMVVARVRDVTASVAALWGAESGASIGPILYINPTGVLVAQLSNTTDVSATVGTGLDDSALRAFAFVKATSSVRAYESTAGLGSALSTAALGSPVMASPRVGARAYSVTLPTRAEITTSVHWPRALTATELDAASAYLLGSYR